MFLFSFVIINIAVIKDVSKTDDKIINIVKENISIFSLSYLMP